VVISNELKRFAHDTRFHLDLRDKFSAHGAIVNCLNFKFESSYEGRFVKTMFAALGQLERQQYSRQVAQKMRARVERGYYVFNPPIGYRYDKDKAHSKLLVRNEPAASILIEALEGYASGRFSSQVEVRCFLESEPNFPKSRARGRVHPSRVKELLTRPIYAGCVEAPD
jgi:DNA invertase Pin-like site-specific DNA recombinase